MANSSLNHGAAKEHVDDDLDADQPECEMDDDLFGDNDAQSGWDAEFFNNLETPYPQDGASIQPQQLPLAQQPQMPPAQGQPAPIAQQPQIPPAQPQLVHHMHPSGYPVMPLEQQPAAHTLEEIAQLRGRHGGRFVPIFTNMEHAYASYEVWQSLANEATQPGSNDRVHDTHRLDDTPFIEQLQNAFRNTEDTFEFQNEEKRREERGLEPIDKESSKPITRGTDEVNNYDLQLILWRLLSYIYDAQAGKNNLPLTYSVKTRGYEEFPNFQDRFDKVKECLTQSKLMCKDLLNGDDYISRLAWNPSAELRRKQQNSAGNGRRDVQNRAGALAMGQDYIKLDDNGTVLTKTGEELGKLARPKHTDAFKNAMKDIPTRKGSTDSAKCHRKMGTAREETRGKPRARPAKRARTASKAAGSETSATPASDAQSPPSQPSGMEAPQSQTPATQPSASNDSRLDAFMLDIANPHEVSGEFVVPDYTSEAPEPDAPDSMPVDHRVQGQEGQSSVPEMQNLRASTDNSAQGSMNLDGNDFHYYTYLDLDIGSYDPSVDGVTGVDGRLYSNSNETSGDNLPRMNMPMNMWPPVNHPDHNLAAPMIGFPPNPRPQFNLYNTGPQGYSSSNDHGHQATLDEWFPNGNADGSAAPATCGGSTVPVNGGPAFNQVMGPPHTVAANGARPSARSSSSAPTQESIRVGQRLESYYNKVASRSKGKGN